MQPAKLIPIVPAIIPASEADLKQALQKIAWSPEVQIDVVDGKAVPFVSWPFEPKGDPSAVKKEITEFTVEVDLMTEKPLLEAEKWLKAGADMLVFHLENISLADFSFFTKETKISVGISALNDTPFLDLVEYVKEADYVQLMGIAEIGTQGQPFDERVLERIKKIKELFPQKPISIDGSVNEETIERLVGAGADRLIVGSAITKKADTYGAYESLCALI